MLDLECHSLFLTATKCLLHKFPDEVLQCHVVHHLLWAGEDPHRAWVTTTPKPFLLEVQLPDLHNLLRVSENIICREDNTCRLNNSTITELELLAEQEVQLLLLTVVILASVLTLPKYRGPQLKQK